MKYLEALEEATKQAQQRVTKNSAEGPLNFQWGSFSYIKRRGNIDLDMIQVNYKGQISYCRIFSRERLAEIIRTPDLALSYFIFTKEDYDADDWYLVDINPDKW